LAKEYDVVVLGGGTGGYVAAIRAAKNGLKTAIVEKSKLGGTCLHKGCIPTKTLLRSAEVYRLVRKSADFGVDVRDAALNFAKIRERKNAVVAQLHRGVQSLMKKGKIDVYEGTGRILGPSIFSPVAGTVSIEGSGADNEMLLPKNLIIATGSRPRVLPGFAVDGEYVMTSDEALEMEELPASILIAGGGAIGVEWASMLADFGVKVTVIEASPRLLPGEDSDISKEITRLLKKKGVAVFTGTAFNASSLQTGGKKVRIGTEDGKTFEADKLLLSVGRLANTENIGLENTDIEIKNGVIKVNEVYQTKESHIYAIGDCIGGLQLAHAAAREGIIAADRIAEKSVDPLDDTMVPKCVYSNPEIASVGLTEEKAKEEGYDVKIGRFSFQAVGKALVYGETDGFVKIVADAKTDDLLGVHIIGPHATDMISEAGLARVLDAAPWEVAMSIHPHPTLSEAIGEAALAVDGLEIHA